MSRSVWATTGTPPVTDIPDELSQHWESHAAEWIGWADPAHEDGFWSTTWPALASLLPRPAGRAIDVGCGEGRGSRELVDRGFQVIGVDTSPTLVAAANTRGTTAVLGDATALPVSDSWADLVLASMSLMDIGNLDGAISEIARVLQPDGVLVAAIVHPIVSAFDVSDRKLGQLTVTQAYQEVRRYTDDDDRDGRRMLFSSMHRPLSAYISAMGRHGLCLDAMVGGRLPWMLAWRARCGVGIAR